MKNVLLTCTILIFIFYDALENFSVFLNYPMDEIIIVFFGTYILYAFATRPVKLLRYEITILKLYTLFIAVNLIVSLLNEYNYLFNVFLDVWLLSKFLFAYFFARVFYSSGNLKQNSISSVFRTVSVITGITCLFVLINLIFGFFESHEYRWGIETQKIFFSHPTYLASVLIIGMLIRLGNYRNNFFVLLMYSFAIFLTGRNKAVLFLIIMLGVYFGYRYYKNIKFSYLLILIIPSLYLFRDVLTERLLSATTSARYILYETAHKISLESFPFGSGFASFASYASIYEYSNIYEKYGLNFVYGFSEENPQYLTDSFFAMLLGQTGYFGVFIFGVILLLYFKILRSNVKYTFFSSVSYIYLLMSLFTENFLSTGLGIGLFIIYGLITNETLKEKEWEYE